MNILQFHEAPSQFQWVMGTLSLPGWDADEDQTTGMNRLVIHLNTAMI